MENFEVVVKDAYYVTKDTIKETKAFEIEVEGSYSSTVKTIYYLGEKVWKTDSQWSGKEVMFDYREAQKLKKKKMADHLKWLRESKETTEKQIAEMEEQLKS